MSFKLTHIEDVDQMEKLEGLPDSVVKMMLNSFYGNFANLIFPCIDESIFSPLYSDNPATRPNSAPLSSVMAAEIIRIIKGWSEDEMLLQINTNISVQYAIHTLGFEKQPFSDCTFYRLRARVEEYRLRTGINLFEEAFTSLANKFCKILNIDGSKQRMDSLLIKSSGRKCSRVEIMYMAVYNVIRLFYDLGRQDLFPSGLLHYLHKDDRNAFVYHSHMTNKERYDILLDEMLTVKAAIPDDMADNDIVQLFLRIFDEHTITDDNGTVSIRPSKKIIPSSAQSFSDPDATYHKKGSQGGPGYSANIVESVVGSKGPSIVTDFKIDKNTRSDISFIDDYLDRQLKADPKQGRILVADGNYASEAIVKKAASKNITFFGTALKGRLPRSILADFELDKDGKILKCPAGHSPDECRIFENRAVACMNQSQCSQCPHKDQCKPSVTKKMKYRTTIRYSSYKKALTVKQGRTEDYIKYSHLRNAVEAVVSTMRNQYGIDRVIVYGLPAKERFLTFCLIGFNVKKVIKHNPCEQDYYAIFAAKRAKQREEKLFIICYFGDFKEQLFVKYHFSDIVLP